MTIEVVLGGSEGKMGKVLQRLIGEADDMVLVASVDPRLPQEALNQYTNVKDFVAGHGLGGCVYVDFTNPDEVLGNVKTISEAGHDSVIGTTGWYDRMDEMETIAKLNGRRIVYAPNFSIGVNALFAVTEYLAGLLGKLGYDAEVMELHHIGKKDAPSGTAVELGKILVAKMPGKAKYTTTRTGPRAPDEVDVLGGRVGSVVGHHRVHFVPNEDYCERLIVEHDGFSRDTFGFGALTAVRWVYRAGQEGKPTGLCPFRRDVLGL